MSGRLYVVTGGPGSGKSALVAALAADGVRVSDEAGRAVIRQQTAIGGQALPWADRLLFAELMLSWDMRAHEAALAVGEATLFDRGAPDVLGYLALCGIEAPAHMRKAAETFRYADEVFVAPPWREIFTQDAERRQDFPEAERTFDAMIEVYTQLGYRLVELPKASVADRAAFVRARLAVR